VFQGQATILLPQAKGWVFPDQWQGLEIIRLMQHKEWPDLELQDLVHQDLELDLRVELIVLEQDQVPAERVQVLAQLSQDLVAVHREAHFLPGDQLAVAVAASVAEPLERLVRVEQEDRARLESPSALSEKNLNNEASRA
jgi:hypothetical protein